MITLEGALKLIMWLPGDMAKDYRSRACGILTCYLDGDSTLVEEIEANTESSAQLEGGAADPAAGARGEGDQADRAPREDRAC